MLFDRLKINQVARETKLSQRDSPIDGFLFMTTYVFAVAIYGKPSLEQMTALLNSALKRVDVSRQAIDKRINEHAVEFFRDMLSQSIRLQHPQPFSLELLSAFNHIYLADSTGIELPAHLVKYFQGAGGNASKSALKIQFCYDLKTSQFSHIITEGRKNDTHYDNSFVTEMAPGDLRISDLGYSSSKVFVEIAEVKNAYYLSRLKSDLPLYQKNEEGEYTRFDLISFLKKSSFDLLEIEVYLKSGQTYSLTRLVIEPVPEEVTKQRLTRLAEQARKKGTQTKKETKSLQAFNLHISNVPSEFLDAKHFKILYSLRWQVELIFKSWKSNLNLDEIPDARYERVMCDLYAKLFFIFLTHKIHLYLNMGETRGCFMTFQNQKKRVCN